MKIEIAIDNVQQIKSQRTSFDLSQHKLSCIVGKNGVGKTTLIRAIRNLAINSTFHETAAPYIFSRDSKVTYIIEGLPENIIFTYNRFLNGIDSKQRIPDDVKAMISVELPIPHGERFNHFRRLAEKDAELRAKIAIGEYSRPKPLIDFLSNIYCDNRFENLIEVNYKKTCYYFILKDEDRCFSR